MPDAIVARDLVVRRGGRRVLDGVSLSVAVGEHLAVLGPNGAGKSTLLAALWGGLEPASGTIEVQGTPLASLALSARARRIAVLGQSTPGELELSVQALVELARAPWVGLFGGLGSEDHRLVEAAIEAVSLGPSRHRPVSRLSGGERQRAFLAHALAQGAPILLLDEPTTHLDLAHQLELLERVRAPGRTIVSVLHDPAVARRYADRVLCLRGGKVIESGPVESTITAPVLARLFDVEVDAHGPAFAYRPRRA